MRIFLVAAITALFLFVAACGAQPPLGHSEGPELVPPVVGRAASAIVERGTVEEIQLLPGMIRMDSAPLFFAMSGAFERLHVSPGQEVYEGQLLATLYTPQRREQLETQLLQLSRLQRNHARVA